MLRFGTGISVWLVAGVSGLSRSVYCGDQIWFSGSVYGLRLVVGLGGDTEGLEREQKEYYSLFNNLNDDSKCNCYIEKKKK